MGSKTPTCAPSGLGPASMTSQCVPTAPWVWSPGGEAMMAVGWSAPSAAGTVMSRRQALSTVLLGVMESTLAADHGLLKHWCLQFQVPTSHSRKVEGNLANIIRTCQVFFSIFIYVQRLARSFQMPGMYCSLEELQYPAVFNVKGKPFH